MIDAQQLYTLAKTKDHHVHLPCLPGPSTLATAFFFSHGSVHNSLSTQRLRQDDTPIDLSFSNPLRPRSPAFDPEQMLQSI